MLGIIMKDIESKTGNFITLLYRSMVLTHLKDCVQFWSMYLRNNSHSDCMFRGWEPLNASARK